MSELFKPGTFNPPAGVYLEVGPLGESINDARIVVIQFGDKLPLTRPKYNKWLKIVND